MTRTLIVTGAGGVGKTTVSAALAVAAARSGRRTLALTVDPARRLADALGIPGAGNDPVTTPEPNLSAAMLDSAAAWEAIALRHASPPTAARLIASPYFRAVADRFPGGQAYAAGEEMLGHLESGRYDLIVVDTPPAQGGIEFFTAPRRVRSLVGGRILRWLTGARVPGRRAVYRLTARPALRVADRILGTPLLEEVAEFLLDLRETYDGVTRRSRRLERHFKASLTIVVTTTDPAPLREARRFFSVLPDVASPPAAFVFNRTLPGSWAGAPAPPRDGPLEANLRRWAAEAHRQAEARSEIEARYGIEVATLPWVAEPPTDTDALASLLSGASGLDKLFS